MYQDKVLVCADCGSEFIWTAGEQEFFASKGFGNEPKRCKECREAKKVNRGSSQTSGKMYDVVCDMCGKACQVPFRPSGDKPIYCSDCFSKLKGTNY